MLYCCRATNTSGKDNISWHANLNSDLHKKTTNQTVIWSRGKLSRQQTVNQAFKLSTSQNTKGIFIWSWGAPSNHTSGIGSKWLLWCNQMKTVNDVQTWERLFFFFSVQCQAQTADQNLLNLLMSPLNCGELASILCPCSIIYRVYLQLQLQLQGLFE